MVALRAPMQKNYTIEDFSEYNKNNKIPKLKTITAGLNNQLFLIKLI